MPDDFCKLWSKKEHTPKQTSLLIKKKKKHSTLNRRRNALQDRWKKDNSETNVKVRFFPRATTQDM